MKNRGKLEKSKGTPMKKSFKTIIFCVMILIFFFLPMLTGCESYLISIYNNSLEVDSSKPLTYDKLVTTETGNQNIIAVKIFTLGPYCSHGFRTGGHVIDMYIREAKTKQWYKSAIAPGARDIENTSDFRIYNSEDLEWLDCAE